MVSFSYFWFLIWKVFDLLLCKINLSSLRLTKSYPGQCTRRPYEVMIKEEGLQRLQRSVRMPSQRQMISKPIRSGILIMRMEISVRYPIRPPKMESSHYLIFMMKTDGCRRLKENCIPRGRQQRKFSEVIPMMHMEKSKRSRITGIC